MKIFQILSASLVFTMISVAVFAQNSPVGTWKTIDDEDGKVKSHVTIVEKGGKLYGTVTKLISSNLTHCNKCKDDKKGAAIEGLEIIWNMEKDNDEWEGGKILDPKTGKEYKCKMSLEDPNTLNVRGFIGFSLLGRTQTWYRVD